MLIDFDQFLIYLSILNFDYVSCIKKNSFDKKNLSCILSDLIYSIIKKKHNWRCINDKTYEIII